MLFFPMGPPFGSCPEMDRYHAKAVDSGGVRYYLKEKSHPDNWIIIFHGNAGNACDRTYFWDLLSGLNSNLVLFEYPGYGKDSNSPGEKLILKQALELVSQIKKTKSGTLPVFLMGESLGTGVATWVSTQIQVSGLIMVSAYTSIADVAQNHYPWLPVKYLLKHKFLAYAWAKEASSAAILFHGIDDDIIPIQFAREQVVNFKEKAELIEIENCGHNDIVDVGGKILKERIKAFISKN
ncbi:MAG: alpha/beta hydrolase [Desulfobacula sp.]|nr:alpha/beta hydrolase [Desulfobacula sp.]